MRELRMEAGTEYEDGISVTDLLYGFRDPLRLDGYRIEIGVVVARMLVGD